ncbi:MAG: DNA cytosine methyltransferase [Tannerellaceae bacterium]|nr:DNA cytosine methyltransferase [Tannerellaceae bacterium]
MDNKIGIFSFFAGAGFLDLGFESTQLYKTLFVNEIHKPFMEIYQHSRSQMSIPTPKYGYSLGDITSFLEKKNLADLKKKVEKAKKEHPLIGFMGGPPCPDFSIAGKNKGKDGENGVLSGTYVELICKIKPDFFLFENVKGLYRTQKHRAFFEELKNKLKKAGYAFTEQVINTLEFGAPQDRERIILIGFHKKVRTKYKMRSQVGGHLEGFDWNRHKSFNIDDIMQHTWPETDPYMEDGILEIPAGIIPELTIEHWFQKNDVLNHINQGQFFTPRDGLARFIVIEEGDDAKNHINVYTVGAILLLLLMEIMKYIYTPIKPDGYLLQKH